MDDERYIQREELKQDQHEALCKCCGVCCGAASNDPCSQLIRKDNGKYYCATYADRLGPQRSLSGNIFTCVRIGDVLRVGVTYPDCGYCRNAFNDGGLICAKNT